MSRNLLDFFYLWFFFFAWLDFLGVCLALFSGFLRFLSVSVPLVGLTCFVLVLNMHD